MIYDSIAAALHNTSSSWYGHVTRFYEPFSAFCFNAEGERSMANSRYFVLSSLLAIGLKAMRDLLGGLYFAISTAIHADRPVLIVKVSHNISDT
jgi:hypothetical protein